MKTKISLLLTIVLTAGSALLAQNVDNKRVQFVQVGDLAYAGDYSNDLFKFHHGIAVGAGLTQYLSRSVDILANLNIGLVNAKNATMASNGTDFNAKMINFNLLAKYKIDNGYLLKENPKLSPYIIGGIGALYSISDGNGYSYTTDNGINNSAPFSGRKVFAFNFCAGAGIKYQLTNKISLYFQPMAIMPLSDKFDGWYQDIIANKRNDMFLSNSIGVIFAPGK